MVRSLAGFCFDHRRLVAGGWVALLVGLLVLGGVFGGEFHTSFDGPDSDSKDAITILQEHGFGSRTGSQGQVAFAADQGVRDPAVQAAMERFFAVIETSVPGTEVVSPYSEAGARQVSDDGRIAYAEVNFSERTGEEYVEAGDTIKALRHEVAVDGLRVELGGDMFAEFSEPSSELIGIAGAAVILLLAFGSLLAMGLPILAALFGIGSGLGLMQLAMNGIDMPNFTTPVAAMIGIGVGIDYALFIVTRYRSSLHHGQAPREAVETAIDTAGRAVMFAGVTVVISLMGLVFMDMPGLAIGASLSVLMTMLAAITLVPAVLGFAGRSIDRFGLPHRKQAEGVAKETFWHRWSRLVQRYPWPAAIGAVALLVVLAVPVFSLRLGFSDAGNRPDTDTSRRAYDLLSEGFGPGFNGPMLAAAETPNGQADRDAMAALSERLNGTPGIAFASPVIANADGTAAIITIIPTTSPQERATANLVHDLRDEIIPGATAGSALDVKLGGVTASAQDFSDYTAERLPVFMGAVLALSFLLLLAVFRSVLVPLKAILMNLLSIGAAYGVLVAIFQWGWGLSLLGVGREGPVEAWVPMMLFAIVFGLSMDYEVFLLSRIREEFDRTGDNATAVADGLAATARVISAAAAIMVFVFASFVLGDERALKMAGLGLAVAVAVDATIIRLILVPAAMELLGNANWWMPRWLGAIIPRIHVEGREEVARIREGAVGQ
ncbi:MAG: MMPL family transporter [Dehalococcoidia bacterium]|nr:MMPL family transporter [Dehalococcoidia bacterium]